MYSTICKIINISDRHITEFVTAGFSGQLKGWWDHYLTPVQKYEILGATKIDPNTNQAIEKSCI